MKSKALTILLNSTDNRRGIKSRMGYLIDQKIDINPKDKQTLSGVYLKQAIIPRTVHNISSALLDEKYVAHPNNTLRYNYNGGAWKVITLPNGIYSVEAINAGIRAAFYANNDFEIGPNSPLDDKYGVYFGANDSTGKGYIATYAIAGFVDPTLWHIDLTNNGTSYFYELLGFRATDNDLTGATAYVSLDDVYILGINSRFYIRTNLVSQARNDSLPFYNCLYSEAWRAAPNGLENIGEQQIAIQIDDRWKHGLQGEITCEIVNRYGQPLIFGDSDNLDSEISIELGIEVID